MSIYRFERHIALSFRHLVETRYFFQFDVLTELCMARDFIGFGRWPMKQLLGYSDVDQADAGTFEDRWKSADSDPGICVFWAGAIREHFNEPEAEKFDKYRSTRAAYPGCAEDISPFWQCPQRFAGYRSWGLQEAFLVNFHHQPQVRNTTMAHTRSPGQPDHVKQNGFEVLW